MSEGGDDSDAASAKHIWDLQSMSDQSAHGASVLQHIQLTRKKVGLEVSNTVLEALKLIAQRPEDIPENSVLSCALTAGCDDFKLQEQPLLRKADKLKDELIS